MAHRSLASLYSHLRHTCVVQVGFNPREGLILHQVFHEDVPSPSCAGDPEGPSASAASPSSPAAGTGPGAGGRGTRALRPVLHRASMVEMCGEWGHCRTLASRSCTSSSGGRHGAALAMPQLHSLHLDDTRPAPLAVPYADPSFPYTRKCAFDLGEEGGLQEQGNYEGPLTPSAPCR
jgi:hypothetical protein